MDLWKQKKRMHKKGEVVTVLKPSKFDSVSDQVPRNDYNRKQ